MSMTKETLFKIVEDAKMEPLIDEEVSGKQFGWRKMTTERRSSCASQTACQRLPHQ